MTEITLQRCKIISIIQTLLNHLNNNREIQKKNRIPDDYNLLKTGDINLFVRFHCFVYLEIVQTLAIGCLRKASKTETRSSELYRGSVFGALRIQPSVWTISNVLCNSLE